MRHDEGPTTERLFMRAFVPDDAKLVFSLRSRPEILRYTGEPPLPSIDEARSAIVTYPDFDTVGYGRWGLFLRSTGEGIGFCGLKYLPELDAVDLGYRLLPEHWGHGYATEAAHACVRFGFDTLGLAIIVGLVQPDNHASVRVLEKVGMRFVDAVDYLGEEAHRYAVEAEQTQ